MEKDSGNAVIVAGLWDKTSKGGEKYRSVTLDFGALGKVHGALFPNRKKESENQPDHLLMCHHAEIGVFWLTESHNGEKHLVGKVLGVSVRVFRNGKSKENAPDYRMVRFLEVEAPPGSKESGFEGLPHEHEALIAAEQF